MATVRVWPITLPSCLLFFKHLPTVESTWNCSLKAQTYYGKWGLANEAISQQSINQTPFQICWACSLQLLNLQNYYYVMGDKLLLNSGEKFQRK